MEEQDNLTDKQKENYERLIFAIAILYAKSLGINPLIQTKYSDLNSFQKTFAEKIYEKHPSFKQQVLKDERISEQTLINDTATVELQDEKHDLVQIITVGDQKVCHACTKWQNKIISITGKNRNYPSLQDAINDGFLHYGCRCSLREIEIIQDLKDKSDDYLRRKNERDIQRGMFMNTLPQYKNIIFT